MIPQWTARRRNQPYPTESMSLTYQKVKLSPPAGIGAPDLDLCSVEYHDYGNNNVQAIYTCEQIATGGTRYRCTWSQWNSDGLQFQGCVQLAPRPHYHEVHGGSEGPQGYAPRQPPPYVPSMTPIRSLRANPSKWSMRFAATVHPQGDQTPVCPTGTEVCGDPTPGNAPPCCPIKVQGPTPASTKWGARYAAAHGFSIQRAVEAFFRPIAGGVRRISNLGRRRSSGTGGCGACSQ